MESAPLIPYKSFALFIGTSNDSSTSRMPLPNVILDMEALINFFKKHMKNFAIYQKIDKTAAEIDSCFKEKLLKYAETYSDYD